MVLFCVVLICVGGCTSKAPFTSALAPASGANNYLCVTACEVAVCGVAGSGGCRGMIIVVPSVCVVSGLGRAPTVSLAPPPPVFSLFSAPPPLDFRSVHPAVGRANCAWKRFNLMRATTRHRRPAQVSDIVCVGPGALDAVHLFPHLCLRFRPAPVHECMPVCGV
jgi:hypothetical protein